MSTNFTEGDSPLSDWISQAEAARIHGVSRQAIHKLIQVGRIKTTLIGGHVLVSRRDLEEFRRLAPGRPRADAVRDFGRVKRLLEGWPIEDRRELFRILREEFPLHPLEVELDIPAEVILEAISRSGPLTIRMIRGVIAESAFDRYIVKKLGGWESLAVIGERSHDFLLKEGDFPPIKVQVKLQRSRKGVPLLSHQVARKYGFGPGLFVVETQKTRAGKHKITGQSTRPYRFGEFEILAVATYPSSKNWESFVYTVGNWLIPQVSDPTLIETYQPVVSNPNEDWTDDFETCVEWFRSGMKKTIRTANA